MHHRFISPIVTVLLLLGPAAASDITTAIAAVSQAISKGHGVDCDLAMKPSVSAAYYPCIDVGPYRFVIEYGRTRGFVLVPDQDPFEILLSDAAGTRFTVQGAWTNDLAPRVAGWWSSLGAGNATSDRSAAAGDAVNAYLRSLEPAPTETEVQAAQPESHPAQPQVFYIVPPNYTPQTSSPPPPPAIPSGYAPNGGVLLAPGVVGYPVTGGN